MSNRRGFFTTLATLFAGALGLGGKAKASQYGKLMVLRATRPGLIRSIGIGDRTLVYFGTVRMSWHGDLSADQVRAIHDRAKGESI